MKSNSDLKLQIQEALENDPEVDVEFLGVQVAGGTVTLSGNVTSDNEKMKAEDIVHGVLGVAEVTSNLQVTGQPEDMRNADAARPWFPSGG